MTAERPGAVTGGRRPGGHAGPATGGGWRGAAVGGLVVLGVALVLWGGPVPRTSEELYLTLVRRWADPGFAAGDWTLSGRFSDHWVFTAAAGTVARVVPIVVLGWVGRLAFWWLLGTQLVLLGTRLGLTRWAATAAVAGWLVFGQAGIGGEWIVGTFEAKTVAYAALLGAALAATRGSVPWALAGIGATVSLHPAVGLWAGGPLALALVAVPETRAAALRWAPPAALVAAPGVVGAWLAAGPSSPSLDRFLVLQAMPYHLDPFFGAVRWPVAQATVRWLVLGAMAAFCWWEHLGTRRRLADRIWITWIGASGVAVLGALAARTAEAWWFLRLMPLRAFPVLVALGAAYRAAGLVSRLRAAELRRRVRRPRWRRPSLVAAVVAAAVAVGPTTPLLAGPRAAARTAGAWVRTDPEADAFAWVRRHLPPRDTCILPPTRQDSFWRAQRPQVGNWQAVRQDALAAWRRRVTDLVGGPGAFTGPGWTGEPGRLAARYDRLGTDRVRVLAARYGAGCLVTRGRHPFPVLHRAGPVTVYRLDAGPPGADRQGQGAGGGTVPRLRRS